MLKYLYRKIILDNDVVFYPIIFIISIIAYLYIRFVMLTSRFEYIIDVDKKQLKSNTYILAFWHGRLLSAFFIRKFFSKAYVLISFSKSAYLVKLIANYFRTSVTRGSKNKGGIESLRDILTILKNKETVFAIAPDGSIGPLMRCNPGVITVALIAKVPILPIVFSAKKGILLNSWDKFFIPLPFNKITVYLKSPIYPFDENGKKLAEEHLRSTLENTLNTITWQLDELYGKEKLYPADKDKKGNYLKIKDKS